MHVIDKSNQTFDIPDEVEEGPDAPTPRELVAEKVHGKPKGEAGEPEGQAQEPEPEQGVETDSPSVVESGAEEHPDPALEAGGQLDQAEPDLDNSDPSPPAKEQPLILGKFKSQADLERSYNHLERNVTQLQQRTKQLEWQTAQAEEALAKAQQVPSEPPLFADLPPDQQERLQHYADRYGITPQQILYQHWQQQQVQAQATVQQAKTAQESRDRAWREAAEELVDYSGTLNSHADRVQADLMEHPEIFEVLRKLEPAVMRKWGRHYVDLLQAKAELEQSKKQQASNLQAARQAGRKEAQDGRDRKLTSGTMASKVRTVSPSQTAPRKQPAKMADRLLAARQQRDAAYAADTDW